MSELGDVCLHFSHFPQLLSTVWSSLFYFSCPFMDCQLLESRAEAPYTVYPLHLAQRPTPGRDSSNTSLREWMNFPLSQHEHRSFRLWENQNAMSIITKLVAYLTLEIIREISLLKWIKAKLCMHILDHIFLPISILCQTKSLFICKFPLTLGGSNLVQMFPHLSCLFSTSFYLLLTHVSCISV